MKKILIIILSSLLAVSSLAANESSSKINKALNQIYEKNSTKPQPHLPDEKFVRKAYLGIAGRIPSYGESVEFINSKDPSKREKLVDQLVASDDFVSHWYNYWADILRTSDRLTGINYLSGDPYIKWIKDSIKNDKPYNVFVYELLTAKGTIVDNPATGYFWRDRGMPLDNLAGTAEIFLGTDISCAQCHDDPFQEWTQMDFYQFAAFFAQNTEVAGDKPEREKINNIKTTILKKREEEGEDPKRRGIENQVTQLLGATVRRIGVNEEAEMKLPHDYKYEDAQPNTVVKPRVLFGDHEVNNLSDLREDFAQWATSETNPMFTKNIVNRLWGEVFGEPIIDPVGNMANGTPRSEELLKTLQEVMIAENYSFKGFLTALYKTELFQRYPVVTLTKDYVYQGPALQRLSAEQIWDSLLTISLEDPNYFHMAYADKYEDMMSVDVNSIQAEDAIELVSQYNELRRQRYDGAKRHEGLLMVRASEVHDNNSTTNILHELGQSERILIENSSRNGSVTQVIALVNGPVSTIANNKESALMKLLANKDKSKQIEIAFMAILSRRPTLAEKSTVESMSIEDIVWALTNSHEFKFN